MKKISYEKFIYELSVVFSDDDIVKDMILDAEDIAKYGEKRIALENLLENIYENEIIISLELIDIAEDAFSDAPNDYDKEIISDLRKMMRGNLKNDEYFEERLIKSDEEVAHYEELVAKVCAVRGENDRGVQNGYGILTSIYQNRLNLLYTSGSRNGEIRETYSNLLKYYAKIWESDNSYFELIKVLSLAVLLNIDSQNESLTILKDKIRESGYADYLVDKFMRFIDNSWNGCCLEFKWEKTYEPLKEIADCKDKAQALLLLKEYLDNQWYDIHKDCAWYDTHKTSKTAYYGYWSFEAGAIVKILSLDDSMLEKQAYYPYDLVHLI